MIGYARQRLTMVETQLRPNAVTDTRLLAAMSTLPRERFVPERLRALAYIDEGIEVFPAIDGAPARYLLAPMVLARIVQLAAVEAQDAVLDVGCATGYSTALLAQLGHNIVGLEPEPELADAARANLRELGLADAGHRRGAARARLPRKRPLRRDPHKRQRAGTTGVAVRTTDGGRQACGGSLPRRPWNPRKGHVFVKAGGEVSGVPHFDAGAPPLPGFLPEASFSF